MTADYFDSSFMGYEAKPNIVSGHYQLVSKTPFELRFAGRLMEAQYVRCLGRMLYLMKGLIKSYLRKKNMILTPRLLMSSTGFFLFVNQMLIKLHADSLDPCQNVLCSRCYLCHWA